MNCAKEFFHDEALLNFKISGTRARQYSVIETVIKQILNECVPMTDLLYNINDDTDDNLKDKLPINLYDEMIDEYCEQETNQEDNTIVIENTRNNMNSIDRNDKLDLLDNTFNDMSELQDSIIVEKDNDETVKGFSELLEKSSMNILESIPVNKDIEAKEIEVVAPIISQTSSTGKSQTINLQPSFINEEKEKQGEKKDSKKIPMVSLRKKQNKKISKKK